MCRNPGTAALSVSAPPPSTADAKLRPRPQIPAPASLRLAQASGSAAEVVPVRAKDAVGRYGEDVAVRHLTEAGLVVLERNWRCREGEIDIVARDGDVLVVCEVKTRRSTAYGDTARSGDGPQGGEATCAGREVARRPGGAPAGSSLRRRRCAGRWQRACACPARARGDLTVALARTRAVALAGVRGQVVDVEVDLAPGLPRDDDRRTARRGAQRGP